MKFTKMHGCGNDYVYVNCFEEEFPTAPGELAVKISDRHFGVGSDGLILLMPPDSADADVRMRMFNADGSEAEMCGNGIRCVAKLAYESGIAPKKTMAVETGAGLKMLQLTVEDGVVLSVRVDMGEPVLERSEIPMAGPAGRVVNEPLEAGGRMFAVTCVSMGNPHCIVYVDDVEAFDVHRYGAIVETHPAFPRRTNVEFVQVIAPGEVKIRTWERGAGETLACGTGASAVCVAGVLTGRTRRRITAHVLGGDLQLQWSEQGNVFMAGPAVKVFEGELDTNE